MRGLSAADALDVEPEAVDGAGPEVGGEHVGRRQQPGEEVATLGLRQVEADGLLPPVGGLEEGVVAVVDVVQAGRDETPVRIAAHSAPRPSRPWRPTRRAAQWPSGRTRALATSTTRTPSSGAVTGPGTSVGGPVPDVVSTAAA